MRKLAACASLISGVQSTDFSRLLLSEKNPTEVGTLDAASLGTSWSPTAARAAAAEIAAPAETTKASATSA